VGYAKFSLTEARPKVADHDMTAVRRAWRGRGIARALKCAQIAWAKRSGFERLETSNEARNHPIRRLNDQLGYRLALATSSCKARSHQSEWPWRHERDGGANGSDDFYRFYLLVP
jgi:GNAT superfamily N-acetyltransferase